MSHCIIFSGWSFKPDFIVNHIPVSHNHKNILTIDSNQVIYDYWKSEMTVFEFQKILFDKVISENKLINSCVIGWSIGAILSLIIAINNNIIDRMILFSPTPAFCNSYVWKSGVEKVTLNRLSKQINRNPFQALKIFNKNMTNNLTALSDLNLKKYQIFKPEVLTKGLEFLSEVNVIEYLSNLSTRLLLVHGTDDSIIPAKASEFIYSKIPNAKLHLVEYGAHIPFITHKTEITKYIEGFLKDDKQGFD